MTVITRQMRKLEQEIIEASQILQSMKKENITQSKNSLKRGVTVNIKNGQKMKFDKN